MCYSFFVERKKISDKFSLEVIDIQSSVKQSAKNTYLLKKKNASLIIHVIDLGYHCYGALFKTRFKEKLFITPIS